jgi:16S rRNA processing protein RimM
MEYVCIGKLVNTHGIKGEVKLLSNFEYKNKVFVVGMNFYIGEDKEKVTVNSYRHHKVFDMVTFKEYNYINDVLKFKGKLVYVLKPDLALDNNSILDRDYIGMNAYYEGVLVGKVKDIIDNNGYKLMLIGTKYVPFNKEFISSVSVTKNELILKNVEGLL